MRWAVVGLVVMLAVAAPAGGAHATYPGLNGKIAFSTNRDGNIEVYSMDPNGSNQTNLSNNPAGDDLPAWSPAGDEITFASNRGLGPVNFDVLTMTAGGGGQTNVTNHSSFDADPVWCGSSRIVFASLRAGNLDVWAMNADGSAPINLTPLSNPQPDDLPDCSPNGAKIAFEAFRVSSVDLYVMNADGSAQTRITTNGADDTYPVWSPDGTRILFERNGDIWAIDPDGTNETPIVTNTSFESAPTWSPDGTKVAFTSTRDGNPEIYIANTDGSSQTRLTNNTASDDFADWQPVQSAAVGGLAELADVETHRGLAMRSWLLAAAALGLAAAALLRRAER